MKKLLNRFGNRLYWYLQIAGLAKPYFRNEKAIHKRFGDFSVSFNSAALDIGSGPMPKNPFQATQVYGADLRGNEESNVIHADLALGNLPFDNQSFDYVTAFDVLEHIQRVVVANGETRFPLIHLMNEVFRVLKPGGIFFSLQPCFPSKEAFQDPTHVNVMTEDTLSLYFCESAWARIYGFEGSFEMLEEGWVGGKFFAFMKKSSDLPIRDLGFVQK